MPILLGSNFFVRVVKEIEKGQMKKEKKREVRDYIGGSGLGRECERRIQYDLIMPTRRAKPEPRMLRIWALGNKVETLIEDLMKDAGFDLATENEKGEQFSFDMGDGRVRGHVDGIFRGGPKIMEYPNLFEAKSAKNSSFNRFVKNGLASENPSYYAQVQVYQKCMKLLNPALWIMMNKDNSEIYAELVPHNPAFADSLIVKAGRILEATDAGDILPRGFSEKTNWNCKYCDYNDECWKEEGTNQPVWAG